MERELVRGMFWAGLLLSSIPLTLGIAVGVYALRRLRDAGGSPSEPGAGGRQAEPPPQA